MHWRLADSPSAASYYGQAKAGARFDLSREVGHITSPTLVIHGDSDGIVPFEVSGKRSHEMLPDSQLVVIEGAPHGFNATHAEQFNRALLDFLG